MENIISAVNDIFGWIAAALTVFVGAPQAWKTFRTKTVKAVSLPTFVLYYTGTLFWILYVSLTPNKFLPLGITDILSCFVLTITLGLVYKYTYIEKQRREKEGRVVKRGYFQSKINPFLFNLILWILYLIYFIFFVVCFVYQISVNGKIFKYIFLTIAFSGVSVVFIHQIITTIKKRSTEGLSFGIVSISLLLNTCWEITWILRGILIYNYGLPAEAASNPELKANLVEELWVGGSFQLIGVLVFLIQTIVYILFHNWKFKDNKMGAEGNFVKTN